MISTFTNKRYEGGFYFIKTLPLINADQIISINTNDGLVVDQRVRFTVDGINYTPWSDQTNAELINEINNATGIKKDVIIEFQFNSASTIDSIEINWSTTNISIVNQFQSSIFATYFDSNDLELSQWYFSVLDRAFNSSDLISNYLKLDKQNADSVQFWKALSKYFSFYVRYARVFGRFYENKELLEEFLKQRDLIINEERPIEESKRLMRNIFAEFFKRGTISIAQESEDDQGELLRLIKKRVDDEFIFNYKHQDEIGWCIGKSSPLYKGIHKNRNANKFTLTEPIAVNNILDYILYVEVRGVGNVRLAIEEIETGTIHEVENQIDIADVIIPLKLFLYGKEQVNVVSQMSTLTKNVTISIESDAEVLSTYFGPKSSQQSYGFIQLSNLLELWLINNNNIYDIDDLHRIIGSKLIPYSTFLHIKDIEKIKVDMKRENARRTRWIASDAVCETVEWVGVDPTCEMAEVIWIGEEETSYIN